MALAPAEIPPISDSMKLNWHSHDYSSVSQSVFPGPNPLVPQKPKKYPVFPEGHRQGRWPAAGPGFPADSACMRMLNRIDRLILLLILGTKRVWASRLSPAGVAPHSPPRALCTAWVLSRYDAEGFCGLGRSMAVEGSCTRQAAGSRLCWRRQGEVQGFSRAGGR